MIIWLPYLMIFLYGVACVLNLAGCTPPERRKLRMISKCFLMPLLAVCYILSARIVSPHVIGAILCGFIGDALLLFPENKKSFAGGLAAFAVGHVLYSIHMFSLLGSTPPWWVCAIIALFYAGVVFLVIRSLRGYLPKGFFLPCLAYMMLIGFMSFSTLLLLIDRKSVYALITFIGSLFFIVSDTILSYDAFGVRRTKYRHVAVMATYLLAQTLIVCGLMYII